MRKALLVYHYPLLYEQGNPKQIFLFLFLTQPQEKRLKLKKEKAPKIKNCLLKK
jgi:hypothetical protein